MRLTKMEIELIRRSHDQVREQLDEASSAFYDNLFEVSEEIRAMFRGDMQDQGMRFMTAIEVIVHALDAPEELERTLQGLGAGHAALGVEPAHYAIMNDVLIDTLAQFAGETWSADTEAAWRKALGEVAGRMREAAHPAT
ncbi:MAG: globin domain-containing protein [Pseudomonadota bacterium]